MPDAQQQDPPNDDEVEIFDLEPRDPAGHRLRSGVILLRQAIRHPKLLGAGSTITLAILLALLVLRAGIPLSVLPTPARKNPFPFKNLFPSAIASVPGETLVVSKDGVLSAIHQGSGTTMWRYEASGIWGMPRVTRGTVLANLQDGRVVALAATTGKVIWFHAKRFSSASLLQVGNGVVFIRDQDLRSFGGSVVALRASDGSLLWQQFTFHFAQFIQDDSTGVAYIGDAGGRITAVRIRSGTFLWAEHTRAWNWGTAKGPLLYIATWDGYVAALHAESGTPLWHTRLRIGASGAPLIGEGNIVLPTTDGGLFVLDAGTGLVRWTAQAAEPLLVSRGLVYDLASNGRMAVRSVGSGVMLREYQDITSVLPVEDTGEMFAVSASGLLAFQTQTGVVRWRWSPPSPIVALSPAGSLVYVSTYSNGVLALRASDGSLLWKVGASL